MKEIIGDNYKIRIGRNAQENFQFISEAHPDDLWFHLLDGPSPHVILCPLLLFIEEVSEVSNERDFSQSAIKQAAVAVKSNSKMKNYHRVSVEYLPIKYVQKTQTLGMVTLRKQPKVIKI